MSREVSELYRSDPFAGDQRAATRRERSDATRRRIVAAARDLIVQAGFTDTTITAIAAAAGVAPQTIYFNFRTKGRLFVAVVEDVAGAQDSATPVLQRQWVREVQESDSAPRALALLVEHGTDI